MRRFILMCVTGAAFAFCILSVWVDCDFVKMESEEGAVISLGLYSAYYRQRECLYYRDVANWDWDVPQFTSTGKTAQAMGVLATLFGSLACLLLIFGSCFLSFCSVAKPVWRKTLGASLLGAAVCQGLTLLFLVEVKKAHFCDEPGNYCVLAAAGLWSIVATCLYFVAGLAFLLLGLQPPKDNPGTTFLARLGNDMMLKMGITWKKVWNFRAADFGLLLFSAALLTCSLIVLLDCHFFTVTFNSNKGGYSEGLVYYYYYPEDSCRPHERGNYASFTAATNAAIAFGCIAVIFGTIILWFLWSMTLFFNYPLVVYKALAPLSFLTGVCQSLTFLANTERNKNLCQEGIEDQHCSLGWNGYLAAVATCLYVLFVPGLLWHAKNPNIQLPEEGEAGSGVPLEKEGVDTMKQPEEPPMVETVDTGSPKED